MKSAWYTGGLAFPEISIPLSVENSAGFQGGECAIVACVISDFHYTTLRSTPEEYDGGVCRLDEDTLARAVSYVNRVKPHFVFLLGDFVDKDPGSVRLLVEALAKLQPKERTFACLGNHDIKVAGAGQVVREALEGIGIRVLWNDVESVFNGRLAIVGLADLFSPEVSLGVLKDIPAHIPRIVLAHNPDAMHWTKDFRVDVMFSGHTHGGQLVVPGGLPLPSLTKSAIQWLPKSLQSTVPSFIYDRAFAVHHWEWAYGLHEVTDETFGAIERNSPCPCTALAGLATQRSSAAAKHIAWSARCRGSRAWDGTRYLYVTAGLGTHPPGRTMCPPEVATVRLAPDAASGEVPDDDSGCQAKSKSD